MTTIEKVRHRAELDARARGYHLNPDPGFMQNLLEGLRDNEERYGYPSCPCRMAAGVFELDRDIICPCDYRDPDVEEYGSCYCCLYVGDDIHEGRKEATPIPERRPQEKQLRAYGLEGEETKETQEARSIAYATATDRKMFYCRQCGYVVFREDPPYVCPICRAKREMFSEIRAGLRLLTA